VPIVLGQMSVVLDHPDAAIAPAKASAV
jgi:hypothetical protein